MTPTPTDIPPEAPTVRDSERKGGCSAMAGSTFTACADCKKGDKTLCSQIGCIAKELEETL
jgi:hypothetical protein